MPSLSSKLKGMLHSDHHAKTRSQRPGVDAEPDKRKGPEERSLSGSASSSASSTETDKSDYVLDVLKSTFQLKHLRTVKDVALQQIDGEPIDDKTYLMERIVQLAADLPVSSRTSATLTNAFLNQLWTDLQHPPQSYLGADYIYRKADGSNNNILWPGLGAAKQPYARTVRPRLMQAVARPDPALLFDVLLSRKKFKPHPNKISSVLFYVASIIIHDIFRTNHDDFSISDTSSYLDLAPLYGSSTEDQHAVRTMRHGKLKPDCFSDIRILGFPPGVGALLIMFNRFHNHVAENLARIDEGGRFSKILRPPGRPKPADAEELYDEALFQTARLVTSGLYVNIILKDYVRTILNLNRADTLWNLDPRSEEGSAFFGHKIPEATGNSVSAEFNLVYRWHSCVSERDEQWTKDAYTRLVGTDSSLSMDKFLRALNEWAVSLSPDPMKREFAGLQRLPDGSFRDEDLASIWTASVTDVAGSYGANHVPDILKNIEVLGIMQSRSWNLASLNEFRQYFKLEPHKTFEDINPDPVIAEQLRRLYAHPDNVEIYPGVVVEAAKEPKLPGSGLCTNFTTSRAILSDAVALVRGDRFYTVDYSPNNLTNWGFNAANYELNINYGCVFYKLVLTALPNNYAHNSIFAHYPLVVPEENKAILAKLKKASLYDFAMPTGTVQHGTDVHRAVTKVSASPVLGNAPGLHLGLVLVESDGLPEATGAFYSNVITKLLQSECYELAGRQYVDVVRDVFNIAHAKFVTDLFLLPQRSAPELIALLSTIHGHATARQPAQRFVLMNRDVEARHRFVNLVQEEASRAVKDHHGLHLGSTGPLRRHGLQAIQAVAKKGLSPEEIASAQIVPLAALILVSQARIFAEILDHVLTTGEGQSPLDGLKGHQPDPSVLSNTIGSHIDRETLEGKLAVTTVEVTLRAMGDLKKLDRAAGPTGRLRRVGEGEETSYLDVEESTFSMYPVSMMVHWEAR
ncbi:Psi-producing oxygenase A [Cladophialophora carrionii]|uniref:Psi-producing oxygenase A n=1 Tax=Cladophialophora carrionii TaxID=86049 RepID=A0A1C1CXV1_9EURO|nr:Psi-producing oxygenase A [Cladophialophora carrionii]